MSPGFMAVWLEACFFLVSLNNLGKLKTSMSAVCLWGHRRSQDTECRNLRKKSTADMFALLVTVLFQNVSSLSVLVPGLLGSFFFLKVSFAPTSHSFSLNSLVISSTIFCYSIIPLGNASPLLALFPK